MARGDGQPSSPIDFKNMYFVFTANGEVFTRSIIDTPEEKIF